MKVRELIAKLEKLPSEADVVVWVEGTGIAEHTGIDDVYKHEPNQVDIGVTIEPDLQFMAELARMRS